MEEEESEETEGTHKRLSDVLFCFEARSHTDFEIYAADLQNTAVLPHRSGFRLEDSDWRLQTHFNTDKKTDSNTWKTARYWIPLWAGLINGQIPEHRRGKMRQERRNHGGEVEYDN